MLHLFGIFVCKNVYQTKTKDIWKDVFENMKAFKNIHPNDQTKWNIIEKSYMNFNLLVDKRNIETNSLKN